MHWLWQFTGGILAGGATFGVLCVPFLDPLVAPDFGFIGLFVYFGLVPQIVGIGTYAFQSPGYGGGADDGETRCRDCGYILRGISEPRCPECGERI